MKSQNKKKSNILFTSYKYIIPSRIICKFYALFRCRYMWTIGLNLKKNPIWNTQLYIILISDLFYVRLFFITGGSNYCMSQIHECHYDTSIHTSKHFICFQLWKQNFNKISYKRLFL